MVNVYPITGKVWYRESTDEWVLELEGSINDTHFISRHTEPGNTAPEDVAGLPSLYKEETDETKLAKAMSALEEIAGNGNAAGRNPQLMADKARATLAEIKGDPK